MGFPASLVSSLGILGQGYESLMGGYVQAYNLHLSLYHFCISLG